MLISSCDVILICISRSTTLPDLHGNDGIIRSSDKQPRQSTTNGCHSDQQVIKMINGHHGNHVDDCMTSSNTAMFARKMPSPEKAKFVPKQEKMFNLATWNANVKDSRVISNTQIAPSSGGSKLDDKDKLLMLQQEQIQHLQSLLQFQEAKMNRMRSETPQQVIYLLLIGSWVTFDLSGCGPASRCHWTDLYGPEG